MNDDYNFYQGHMMSNPTLPRVFITCFGDHQMWLYRQAVAEYTEVCPGHGLVIDESGQWNTNQYPALLCYGDTNLSTFWRLFERIERGEKP